MTARLRRDLETALKSAYTIERELGGGGMSRVFLAEDNALGRKVVVKVLPPELGEGVNVERFKREIQVAARLQHAHIVPVLSAGEMNGIPYYTMPFVEGESLRERLVRAGPLPIAEAISILRDIARGLAYAHDHGVVHRDIKPDNVMLSGGSAVVTDFGIAKAISLSRTGGDGGPLTEVGTSLGTPAYMAPEQAAADPATDHRADLYAFGCVAYEVLAGRPPFVAKTPQKLLAAHMAETPEPIDSIRPDAAPTLAALVMQCLEKDADRRPRGASDVVRCLEEVRSGDSHAAMPAILLGGPRMFRRALILYAVAFLVVALAAQLAVSLIGLPNWVLPGALIVMALGLPAILFTGYVHHTTRRALTATPTYTPGGTQSFTQPRGPIATLAMKAGPHLSWRRTAPAGMYALGAFAVLVAGYMFSRESGFGPFASLIGRGALAERDQVLVADFETRGTADSVVATVVTDGVRLTLGQSRVLTVLSVSEVAEALEHMRRPRDARVNEVVAREIAIRDGIEAILVGEVTPVAETFVITARLVAAASGEVLTTVQETAASASEIVAAAGRAGRSIRDRTGESLRTLRADPPLGRATTESVVAFRKYNDALRAFWIDNDWEKTARLGEEAVKLDSTFSAAYRLISVSLNNAGLNPDRAGEAWRLANRYRARLPERERLLLQAETWRTGARRDREKALGYYEELERKYPTKAGAINNQVVEYIRRRELVRAESLLTRIVEYDRFGAGAAMNLVTAQFGLGKVSAALAAMASARARLKVPSERLDLTEANLRYALGEIDLARALLIRAAAGNTPQYAADAHHDLARLSRRNGQLAQWEKHLGTGRAIDQKRGSGINPRADSVAALDNELFISKPSETLFDRLEGIPAGSNPGRLSLISRYVLLRRGDRATSLLSEYDSIIRPDTGRRRADRPERDGALGWIAFGEGRYLDAISAFRRSDSLPDGPRELCPICIDPEVGRAFDAAGMPDSAIATFEHYLGTPFLNRLAEDELHRAWILERVAQLYEQKNDRANAAKYYAEFIELWKDADAELQPRVATAKQALLRLRAGEGGRDRGLSPKVIRR